MFLVIQEQLAPDVNAAAPNMVHDLLRLVRFIMETKDTARGFKKHQIQPYTTLLHNKWRVCHCKPFSCHNIKIESLMWL